MKDKLQKVIHHLPKTMQKIALSYYNSIGFRKSHASRTLQLEFPIKSKDGSFLFHKPLFGNGTSQGYFTQYYREPEIPQVFLTVEDRLSLKTETLKGRLYQKNKKAKKSIKSECILPVSLVKKGFEGSYIDNDALIQLKINGKKTDLKGLAINRFHYLPVQGNSKIELSSSHDFIAGDELGKRQGKKHKKKLVLVLFIDGFAAEILKKSHLKDMMPHTYRFFSKGIMFNNCYSSSKWTLPNLASMFSGKYAKKHGIFHPSKEIELGKNYPVISNYFQDDGYLTLHVEGGWRLTPSYGYCKGFDRTIYKKNMQESEILAALFEHISAFKERDNFAWLSFMDLHHDMNLLPDIDIQAETPIMYHSYGPSKIKSALIKSFDEKKTYKYAKKLTNIDFDLKRIYDYLEDNYSNDEMLVVLVSDHGQGYIQDSKTTLSKTRTHVPLMVRGCKNKNTGSDEIVSNMDLLPILLHLSGIPYDNGSFDGTLPKIFGGEGREYAITETIYPGEPYTAAITDAENEFYFETEANADDSGNVNANKFKIQMINSKDGNDATEKNPEKAMEYKKIILKHIR